MVLPWLWKLAVGSLRGAVLLEVRCDRARRHGLLMISVKTRYWIAAGAPMDGTLLPRGGVEVIAVSPYAIPS